MLSAGTIHKKLEEIKQKYELNDRQMADVGGVSPMAYNNYKWHRRRLPVEVAIKYSKYFNVSLDELYKEE